MKRGSAPSLQVLTSLAQRLTGNACYFVRVNAKGVTEKTIAEDINFGVVRGDALTSLRTLVNDFFAPVLRKQEKWGRLTPSLHTELLKRVGQFGSTLAEAAESLAGGIELAKPDAKYLATPMTLAGFKEIADKADAAKDFTKCLKSWTTKVRTRAVECCAAAQAMRSVARACERGCYFVRRAWSSNASGIAGGIATCRQRLWHRLGRGWPHDGALILAPAYGKIQLSDAAAQKP